MSRRCNKELGAAIRKARRRKNIRQGKVAKLMRVSQPTIVRIEYGRQSMTVEQLKRMSRIIGFNPGRLVNALTSC